MNLHLHFQINFHLLIRKLFRNFGSVDVPNMVGCVSNTSHTVLGYVPNFYWKLVCITTKKQIIKAQVGIQKKTTHYWCENDIIFFFEVKREGFRPGWNCRHGKLFTQRLQYDISLLSGAARVIILFPHQRVGKGIDT